ncbi:hypothetical protein Q5752_002714 [Cryptotrichosporon argae]
MDSYYPDVADVGESSRAQAAPYDTQRHAPAMHGSVGYGGGTHRRHASDSGGAPRPAVQHARTDLYVASPHLGPHDGAHSHAHHSPNLHHSHSLSHVPQHGHARHASTQSAHGQSSQHNPHHAQHDPHPPRQQPSPAHGAHPHAPFANPPFIFQPDAHDLSSLPLFPLGEPYTDPSIHMHPPQDGNGHAQHIYGHGHSPHLHHSPHLPHLPHNLSGNFLSPIPMAYAYDAAAAGLGAQSSPAAIPRLPDFIEAALSTSNSWILAPHMAFNFSPSPFSSSSADYASLQPVESHKSGGGLRVDGESKYDETVRKLDFLLSDIIGLLEPFTATPDHPNPDPPPTFLPTRFARLSLEIRAALQTLSTLAHPTLVPGLPPMPIPRSARPDEMSAAEREMDAIRKRRDALIAKAAAAKPKDAPKPAGDGAARAPPHLDIPPSQPMDARHSLGISHVFPSPLILPAMPAFPEPNFALHGGELAKCTSCGIEAAVCEGPDGPFSLCFDCSEHHRRLSHNGALDPAEVSGFLHGFTGMFDFINVPDFNGNG